MNGKDSHGDVIYSPLMLACDGLPPSHAGVLDPIFSHVNEPDKWLVKGKFWKDYAVAQW